MQLLPRDDDAAKSKTFIVVHSECVAGIGCIVEHKPSQSLSNLT